MKIFQLFACLSQGELKLLRKAVLSPLYNTNQKVVRLFEILRPLHPHFDDSVNARKKIFKKLIPIKRTINWVYKLSKKPYHNKKLDNFIKWQNLIYGQNDQFLMH